MPQYKLFEVGYWEPLPKSKYRSLSAMVLSSDETKVKNIILKKYPKLKPELVKIVEVSLEITDIESYILYDNYST